TVQPLRCFASTISSSRSDESALAVVMSQRSRCGNEFGCAFERASSVELQGEMDDAALVLALQSETAVFQHSQHRSVIWQHIGDELAKHGHTPQTRNMSQSGAGD